MSINFKSNSSSWLTRCLFTIFFIQFVSALNECETSNIIKNTNCTFEFPSNKNVFHVSGVHLLKSDSFTVRIGDQSKDVKILNSGFIILPKQDNYTFFVNTTSESGSRHILKFNQVQNPPSVTELDEFNILIKSGTDTKDAFIDFVNNDEEKSILLSTSDKGVTASSTKESKTIDTVNLEKKDFLTGEKKIKLSFNAYNQSIDNLYYFNLMKLKKDCSSNLLVKDVVNLTTADYFFPSEGFTCVYLLTSDDESNLQVDKFDFKITSPFDSVTIKDGLKLTSNNLISSRTKDASTYLNNIDNTVSSSSNLMVILSSKFLPKKYEQNVITIKKSSVKKLDKEGPFNFAVDKETIYIFSLQDKYPVLSFDKSFNLTTANLSVYYSTNLSTEPVLEFFENEIVNGQIWSEKKMIVLKFTSSSSNLNIAGKLEGATVNCNQLSNHPSTFILNGSQKLTGQNCNFYFKPKDVIHSITFDLKSVQLDKESCLVLTGVNKQNKLFEMCNKNDNVEKLEKNHLTEIILPNSDSYVLTYKEGGKFQDKILIQASFAYNALPNIQNITLTKDNPTYSLSSYNYPSNYPFILNNEMYYVNSDSFLHISFEKYDLHSGDNLKTFPENKMQFTNGTVDDFLVNLDSANVSKLAFWLVNNFNLSKSLFDDEFSQGFKIDFQRFDCKIEGDPKTSLKTPNYPDKLKDVEKCISIIDLASNIPQYLNLTIKNPKSDNYGNLKIYDAQNIHRQNELVHIFNSTVLKSNETINFNTSSTKLVLIYETLGKPVNGFELTIKVEPCPSIGCDDNTRCLLESIHCNFVQECLDATDEKNCSLHSGNEPPPKPNPTPTPSGGLSGWVITMVIIPLSMLVGAAMVTHGPKLLSRLRSPRSYQEFNTFSENA